MPIVAYPSSHSSHCRFSSMIQFNRFGSSVRVAVIWWIHFIFGHSWSKIVRPSPRHLSFDVIHERDHNVRHYFPWPRDVNTSWDAFIVTSLPLVIPPWKYLKKYVIQGGIESAKVGTVCSRQQHRRSVQKNINRKI